MGWILGPYERNAPAVLRRRRGQRTFEKDLFPGELDRAAAPCRGGHEPGCRASSTPASRDIVKRPDRLYARRQPDGSARPSAWRNFWLSEGHSFGITAAGGAGWQLAEWIVGRRADRPDMIGGRSAALRRRLEEFRQDSRTKRPTSTSSSTTIRWKSAGSAGRPRRRPVYERLDRAGRGLGRALRLGATQLVRARRRRTEGRVFLPALELVCACRQRSPHHARAGRPDGAFELCEIPGRGAGRPGTGSTAWWPTTCPARSRG